MSKYGIKILNYAAGSIHEVNLGVRYKYDTTPAMLTNSLFKDFLSENGLKIWKEESTRDIICIDFCYGSRSYEDEMKHINKLVKKNRLERKIVKSHGHQHQIQEIEVKKQNIANLKRQTEVNKDKYEKKTADQLREDYYVNGVDIKYPKYNKQKEVVGYDVIHYKMLYRTPGKAKKGSCMFIRESLYKKAHNFLWMGLKLPKKNSPIVEIGAYSSLVTSTIEDRIKIEPENILILKDIDSFFKTNVISIETDENKHCQAIPRSDYKVKNTLFDGQALIDESIFPEWANGYVLLRQHFFKAAAFCTKIQKFFMDQFGDKYENAEVVDMWGNKHYAKDIKLITTDNAIKWNKFNVTYKYWSEWVWKNGALFGIVKTAHESKLGDKQRMSYQMVNALDIDSMDEVLSDSKKYVDLLKTDDNIFFDYLRRNSNFSNDYEVLLAICEQNPDFVLCDYFRERRTRIISRYVAELKIGHITQNGDNLVLVGNPYGMLLHSVGENPETDPTLNQESGVIQCWTKRFNDGEYLAGFRSPFNGRGNLTYLHNHYHEYFDEYFILGKQIIAVNCIHTDIEDRNNGSDFDSDSLFVTNISCIVDHAKRCYKDYPTIVNNIPKEKNIYDNQLINYAIIDNKLAASQRDIGESSNLAQICLSYLYNDINEHCNDYVCILSVLAQVSIDSAKRAFDVNVAHEIKRIKQDINIKENGYPEFWKSIRPDVKSSAINHKLKCPMNHVYKLKFRKATYDDSVIPIKDFFIKYENTETKRISKKVQRLIEKYSIEWFNYIISEDKTNEDYFLLRSDYEDLIDDIKRITLPDKYIGLMSWLIDRCMIITPALKQNESRLISKLDKNRSLLLKVLYDLNKESLLKCFKSVPPTM